MRVEDIETVDEPIGAFSDLGWFAVAGHQRPIRVGYQLKAGGLSEVQDALYVSRDPETDLEVETASAARFGPKALQQGLPQDLAGTFVDRLDLDLSEAGDRTTSTYSGGIDGRPEAEYRLSNSPLSERSTMSVKRRISRKG